MAFEHILTMLDAEIARLRQVRNLLLTPTRLLFSQTSKQKATVPKRGRKKHIMTPEGLERLRRSTKRRWRKMKKAGVKSPHPAKVG